MSTYIMSDVHGEADLFHAMLKKVDFSQNDLLYILGDVIDRGQNGIMLLQEIMESPNMVMLLGNHEYMMLQYYSPYATAVEIMRWNKNGNMPTVQAFDALAIDTQESIKKYLYELPTHLQIQVNGRHFYLVHGYPGENTHDEVWNRPSLDAANPFPELILIIGHTPVINMLKSRDERDSYAEELISRGEHPRILHTGSFIDIDCGCSYDRPLKTLGCLRLDDMKEFYVSEP